MDGVVHAPEPGMHKRLPHIDAPGHVQHVVFCVRGAFTAVLLDTPDKLEMADRHLDASPHGRLLVGDAARIAAHVLKFGEPEQYRLQAWCVMPNHVHVLVTRNRDVEMPLIVQRWKSVSARRINQIEGRTGPLWQANYFDRYMRDEAQLAATIDYIECNPVNAGLASLAAEWRWSSAFEEER